MKKHHVITEIILGTMALMIISFVIYAGYIELRVHPDEYPKLPEGPKSYSSHVYKKLNNGDKAILTISTPDSTGTVRVKFDKSRITWVNDSTFTYKVEK